MSFYFGSHFIQLDLYTGKLAKITFPYVQYFPYPNSIIMLFSLLIRYDIFCSFDLNINQMYNQRVIEEAQLPISLQDRKYTDVCCGWIHTGFMITMLIFVLLSPLQGSLKATNPPCPKDTLKLQIQSSLNESPTCVRQCPQLYQMIESSCFPTQKEKLQKLLEDQSIKKEYATYSVKEAIVFCIIFTVAVAIVYLAAAYLLSNSFPLLLISISLVILLLFSLETLKIVNFVQIDFFKLTDNKEKILFIIFSGFGCLVLLGWILRFNKQLKWNGFLIDSSSKIFPSKSLLIIFVLSYYLKIIVVWGLFFYQHYRLTHSIDLYFSWLERPNFTVLVLLNFVELIWNIEYVKSILYLSLSNLISSFYYDRKISCSQDFGAYWLHSGSLSAGSLLNCIFFVPNYLLSMLCCFPNGVRQNCGLFCTSITGLARSDAYAYLSVAAIPICNSSRQSRRICNEAQQFSGVNSPISSFRLFSHIFLLLICYLFFLMVLQKKSIEDSSLWIKILMILMCQSLISGLIDLLLNTAESLQTFILIDQLLEPETQRTNAAREIFGPEFQNYLQKDTKTSTFQ